MVNSHPLCRLSYPGNSGHASTWMGRGHPQTGPALPEAAGALRELTVSRPSRRHCPQGWDGGVKRRTGRTREGWRQRIVGRHLRSEGCHAARVLPHRPNGTPGPRSRCIRVFSVPEQRVRRAGAQRSSNLAPKRGGCTSDGRRSGVERTSRRRRRDVEGPQTTPHTHQHLETPRG